MIHNIPMIKIIDDAPFVNDKLGREKSILNLTELIRHTETPMVMCITSGWGTGKTTFVRIWETHLKNLGCPTIYIDSWATDYTSDPLLPLIHQVRSYLEQQGNEKVKALTREFLKVASELAIGVGNNLVKMKTHGLLDIKECFKPNPVDNFKKTKQVIDDFNKILKKIHKVLVKDTSYPIVLFIDELDRCRPPYALASLEVIKHIFNVEGFVFIVSMDRIQLQESMKVVYGSKFETAGYIRRFFHYIYEIPTPEDFSKFQETLIENYGLDKLLAKRGEYDNQRGIKDRFHIACKEIFPLFDLSLRDQEQMLYQIRILLQTIPIFEDPFIEVLLLLVCMFHNNKEIFDQFINGYSTGEDLIKTITDKSGGNFRNYMLRSSQSSSFYVELYLKLIDRLGNEEDFLMSLKQYYDLGDEATTNPGMTTSQRQRSKHIYQILENVEYSQQMPSKAFFKEKFNFLHSFIFKD